MKRTGIKTLLCVVCLLQACKDQLDITNPNAISPATAFNETGLLALAQGGVYINGLRESNANANYFTVVLRYHELMGDVVLTPVANFAFDRIGCPDQVALADGKTLLSINSDGQTAFLKSENNPSRQNNPLLHEWAFMYALNGAMNSVLTNLSNVNFVNDDGSRRDVVAAWCYYWKGYAYSRLGSIYYAGVVADHFLKTSNMYVSRTGLLQEAEVNFKKSEDILVRVKPGTQYNKVLDALIPSTCRVGKGLSPSPEQWLRNINTMRARNILVNTAAVEMTTNQWNQVLSLGAVGLKKEDNTFTVRSDAQGNLMGTRGNNAGQCIGPDVQGGGLSKISERLIQDFKTGDKRLENNFRQINSWMGATQYGISQGTRFVLIDGGKKLPGVITYCDLRAGEQEEYLTTTSEENLLMMAEANIHLGNVDAGLALIDQVREDQGAGLSAVAGTGLTKAEALEELRRERRIALLFRGLAFYDARRWGVLAAGRGNANFIDLNGSFHNDAHIDYGFLDYWDVPVAEWFNNPPGPGSAPHINPKGN